MWHGRAWIVAQFGFALILAAVSVFGVFHSDDRDPYQWGSALVCGFTWLVLPFVCIGGLVFQFMRQKRNVAPGFDVVVKEAPHLPTNDGQEPP